MKRFVFLLFGFTLLLSAGLVSGQQGGGSLTPAQMNNAINLSNTTTSSGRVAVFAGEQAVYRVNNCGAGPCYLVVSAGNSVSRRNSATTDFEDDADSAAAKPPTVRTVTCGVEIYTVNWPYGLLGKLVNNTSLNYHKGWKGHFGLPVTLLSANTSGTWNTVFTNWTNVSNPPAPNPGWNIKVKKAAGLASTTASGSISIVIPIFGLPIGTQLNAAISVMVTPTQTFCQ